MAAPTTEKSVTLRILIHEEKNKVVYALAGKDFVDILLSFLTFPLGTIARVLAKESDMKNIKVGSLDTLYESVANLGVEHFRTKTCKEMLLQPRNSMETYCQHLKLNIDDTEKIKFYICQKWECSRKESGSLVSLFKNKKCKCGKVMNKEISPMVDTVVNRGGFVQDLCSYIIFDNLEVIPDNFQNCISLPMSFGYQDFNGIKVDTVVNVTSKEIVDILKCSLVSETPLTDYFLRKKMVDESFQPRSSLILNTIGDIEDNDKKELIKLKVVIRKSKIKVLYAVAEADFVDVLLSFLTFPLGGVEYMMKGNSCLGSIDNLYQSVVDLDSQKYMKSPFLKDKLVNTPLAQQFKLKKHILPIDEVPISNISCCIFSPIPTGILTPSDTSGTLTKAECYSKVNIDIHGISYLKTIAPLSYLDPQSSTFETCGSGKGYVKSKSLYMVTDDLIVTTTSSMSLVSFLTKSNVSPSDLEERVISIGKKECLSLLKASLISSSALTDGFGEFLYPMKEEKIS